MYTMCIIYFGNFLKSIASLTDLYFTEVHFGFLMFPKNSFI